MKKKNRNRRYVMKSQPRRERGEERDEREEKEERVVAKDNVM